MEKRYYIKRFAIGLNDSLTAHVHKRVFGLP